MGMLEISQVARALPEQMKKKLNSIKEKFLTTFPSSVAFGKFSSIYIKR